MHPDPLARGPRAVRKWLPEIVVLAVLAAGGLWLWSYLRADEYDAVLDRNRRLAADSAAWVEKLDGQRAATFALALEARTAHELLGDARGRAVALFERAERLEATVIQLTSVRARLRDSLSQLAAVLRTTDTLRVEIDARNQYERGSVAVQGDVAVPTDSGPARVLLNVAAQLDSLHVMLTRMPDLSLQCGVDAGVPFLAIDRVACNQLAPLADPLVEQTRSSLFPELLVPVAAFLLGGLAIP